MNEIDLSNLNIMLIIFGIILIANAVEGYKKGMVKSVVSFVSLIITAVVVLILGTAVLSYIDGEIFNVVVMVLLLCVVGIVHHLLGVVFFSAKAISKLPIVSWVNKLLGIVFGVLETVLCLWIVYTLIMMVNLGMIGQIILDCTEDNQILSWLYSNNYLAYLIEQVMLQLEM